MSHVSPLPPPPPLSSLLPLWFINQSRPASWRDRGLRREKKTKERRQREEEKKRTEQRDEFSLIKHERVCAGPGSVPGSDRLCGPVSVPGGPAAQPDQRPAAGVSFIGAEPSLVRVCAGPGLCSV